jgi:hypothetical protein
MWCMPVLHPLLCLSGRTRRRGAGATACSCHHSAAMPMPPAAPHTHTPSAHSTRLTISSSPDAAPSLCSFATVALAAVAFAAPAVARPTARARSTQPPPPATTVASGDVNKTDSSTSTSTAACNATVSASTWSYAVSSFTNLVADVSLELCNVKSYGYFDYDQDYKQKDKYIQAVATLLLESKLKCSTTGKYALACASSWAGAYSFAGAAYEAYAAAWADASNDLYHCKCAVDVLANADAVTSNWGEIWVSIYQGLDHSVCASSCAPPPRLLRLPCAALRRALVQPNVLLLCACTSACSSSAPCAACELRVRCVPCRQHLQSHPDLTTRVPADDGTPDSIKSVRNIGCVGNLVLGYWVKAIATVIVNGKCEPDEYLACKSCCVNPYGGYYNDCDQGRCKTECEKSERANVLATAQAVITAGVTANSSYCEETGKINYETLTPKYYAPKHVRLALCCRFARQRDCTCACVLNRPIACAAPTTVSAATLRVDCLLHAAPRDRAFLALSMLCCSLTPLRGTTRATTPTARPARTPPRTPSLRAARPSSSRASGRTPATRTTRPPPTASSTSRSTPTAGRRPPSTCAPPTPDVGTVGPLSCAVHMLAFCDPAQLPAFAYCATLPYCRAMRESACLTRVLHAADSRRGFHVLRG